MRTLSPDLRTKILAAYDAGGTTQKQVAQRFMVSYCTVKNLIKLRKVTGGIAPLHHRAGRKPIISPEILERLAGLVREKPDLTLAQLRDALGLECSIMPVQRALKKLNLRLKKKPHSR